MEFKSISIKNFRNFKELSIDISNMNVFFGVNDVGKTNFLYALRFILDKEVRKNNLQESDFHNKNTKNPIEILLTIDISNEKCTDNQKLRAKISGAIKSEHELVYIKLIAHYDKSEMMAIPILYWGGDRDNLFEVKQRGYFFDIDYVFNVIYIDSYVDLNQLFKKNINSLIKNDEEDDKKTLTNIKRTINKLNDNISSLSGIRNFEEKIGPKYKKFKQKDVEISIKSEIAVRGLYSNIVPYIKKNSDEKLYPTAGDGRRKLLAYSIFDLIADDYSKKKVNIFIVEEPENHLHKRLQIALSDLLFNDDTYKYLFISTHSSYILYEMDSVNLVRVFNNNKMDSASVFYVVPPAFKNLKNRLNYKFTEAMFADRVLLVEGPSEIVFFDRVLKSIDSMYEIEGGYILDVGGIGFGFYRELLIKLGIKCILKTDNDMRANNDEYFPLGFSRCNKYIKNKENKLPTSMVDNNNIDKKIELYNKYKSKIDVIRKADLIFLSKSDLENDLKEVLGTELDDYTKGKGLVDFLKKSKHYNMLHIVGHITDEQCRKIYNHYNFACLKEVLNEIN
ncbi:ATP-dependent nuclease [Clostridium sp.]|uniref:ATP-dependent nuclease n=1 Tax=Clostridium sp. TaxID=1506 RepID=UPI002FC853A1